MNLINVMEGATDKWLFTSKIIPDPIMDWSKSPIFGEESLSFEEIIEKYDRKIKKKKKLFGAISSENYPRSIRFG